MNQTQKNRVLSVTGKVLLILLLVLIVICILFPVYFIISTSLKDYSEYVMHPIGIRPGHVSFANNATEQNSTHLLRAFGNSVAITAISVAAAVIFSAIGSFAISVVRFRGSKVFKSLAVITMFFTSELTYIPLYLMYTKLGLINSYWALILPCLIGFPSLGILLGSNYLSSIPNDIHEAALVDGCGVFRLFLQVDLPLMRPVLSLVAVMSFQSAWSEFFWPMITTLGNEKIYTLPLKILEFKAADASMFGEYCAGLTIMTVPMVIVYMFLSKYFIQGMTGGAVKE